MIIISNKTLLILFIINGVVMAIIAKALSKYVCPINEKYVTIYSPSARDIYYVNSHDFIIESKSGMDTAFHSFGEMDNWFQELMARETLMYRVIPENNFVSDIWHEKRVWDVYTNDGKEVVSTGSLLVDSLGKYIYIPKNYQPFIPLN